MPPVRSVVFYTVKPDRTADFLSAAKEFAEEVKKAGSDRPYNVWRSVSGPNEYLLASFHPNFAAMDYQRSEDPKLKSVLPKLNTLSARIMSCVESSRRNLSAVDSEHSLPRPASSPKMVSVIRVWAKPEKVDELMALYAAEAFLAAKKAGLPVFITSRVRFGGSPYEIDIALGQDKWADLDQELPLVKAMGGTANYNKFVAKVRPLITRAEYQMYQHMPEQSYAGPGK